jgi:hypothetical protein
MNTIHIHPRQARAILQKCQLQLAGIVTRATAGNPRAVTIDPAYHPQLNDVVVHLVLTLQRMDVDTTGPRTLITRAYAGGVDRRQRAATVDCVKAISAVVDSILARMCVET